MAVPYLPEYEQEETVMPPATPHHLREHGLEPANSPFAGRIGGNQDFVLDRSDPKNLAELDRVPDAAPCMNAQEIFDLRGFLSPDLWKFAMLECVGEFRLLAVIGQQRGSEIARACARARAPDTTILYWKLKSALKQQDANTPK